LLGCPTVGYRYQHFSLKVILEEIRALGPALSPGDPAPPFALPTADGGTFDAAGLLGRKPLLVTFGSFT
jgi:hypothetical protein